MASLRNLNINGDLKVTGTINNYCCDWRNLTLVNGWVWYANGYPVPSVRRVGNALHFKGLMRSGTSPTFAYLPSNLINGSLHDGGFPVFSSGRLSPRIIVFRDGRMDIVGTYSNAWVGLEGIIELL